MDDSIRYWSDNTMGIGSFSGQWGFQRLLHHAILELDYDKWQLEERGEDRMFLCTLDFNILESRTGRSSLLFRKPQGRRPPPPGMLHIWDILMANWRTIKVDDFGRVQVKTVFPTSIIPAGKNFSKDSIQLVLSNQDIVDKQRSVYGQIHNNFFRDMTPYEKIHLMDEDIKIFGMQKKEEELRLKIKEEIDQKLKEYWEEQEKPPVENVNNIQLNPVDRQDIQESSNVNQSINLNSVNKQDVNSAMGRSDYNNVVNQIQPNQKQQKQNVMNGF